MAHTLRHARVGVLAALCLATRLDAQQGRGDRPTVQPPVLTAFAINGGADTISASLPAVTLDHAVVGARPSEYRVSRRADFGGATWLPYAPAPQLRDWYDAKGEPCDASRASHRVTLYLQVRATVGDELRIIDGQRQLVPARVESNVLRATVCAHGPPSD